MVLDNVRDWLRTIRSMHGLNQAEFAVRIGSTRSTVANWESTSYVPKDQIDSIVRAFPGAPRPPGVLALVPLGEPMFPVGKTPFVLPYAGNVPCDSEWGDPLESEIPYEIDEEYFKLNRWVARVVNDSCFPALKPGDITIWEQDFSPPYGALVCAQRKPDQRCTVKVLQWDADARRPRLLPVNEAYDSPADGEGWQVIARLVAVFREADGPMWKIYYEKGLRPKNLEAIQDM